jgi:DNA (cytosine-5)-methyltransferase 1
MSVAGLFSGIGGFELAFSEIGFESELMVEIDLAALAVLGARFPKVKLHADVLELSALPSSVTIVTAGFPCQNLSMAGDKSGIEGAKSRVVQKMFDLLRRSRVQTVVLENVYFMLQLGSGSAMRWLVERFEELGFHWAYRVLDTMGFGLPQRRRRVYLVASREIDPRKVLFADQARRPTLAKPDLKRPLGFYWTEGKSGVGITVDGIPPLKAGSAIGIPSAPAVLFPDGELLMPSLTACERLQGFSAGWTAVRTADSRRRPEWRMVGNAVSIPVAKWVAQRIKEPGAILDFDKEPFTNGRRWPDAAWNVGNGRVAVVASDRPISVPKLSIAKFRDSSWSRLSDRALNGFIKRAVEGGLKMPEGFLDALRRADRKVVLGTARTSD